MDEQKKNINKINKFDVADADVMFLSVGSSSDCQWSRGSSEGFVFRTASRSRRVNSSSTSPYYE